MTEADVTEKDWLLSGASVTYSQKPRCTDQPSSSQASSMASPKDKCNLVYLCFYFLGLGTLLPWNFFITANDYWMFKLRSNASADSGTPPLNTTNLPFSYSSNLTVATIAPTPVVQYNSLQKLFQNALSICAMLPNVIFQFLNTVLQQRIREKVRIIGTLLVMILLFVLTEVFVKINTNDWQELFFGITMVCVIVLNSTCAIFQSSIFGMSASLPSRYTQAVMAGQGMGGVFASLAMIGALLYSPDPTSSAFAYFMTAIFVLVLNGICYTLLRRNKFFFHHLRKKSVSVLDEKVKDKTPINADRQVLCSTSDAEGRAENDVWVRKNSTLEDNETHPLSDDVKSPAQPKSVPPLWMIFKQIWFYCFSVAFLFFVTLSCFPSIAAGVRSMTTGYLWNDVYFTPVCCFLLYNVTDWIGRSIAGYVHIPSRKNKRALMICVLARAAFPVLFALCNVQPRHSPVVFQNDAFFIVFMVLFGISNGHLSTLTMQYGPRMVNEEHSATAGSMLAFAIAVGLFAGAGFSFVIKTSI